MSTRVITGIALTGMLVLASCMQDATKAPFSPTEPSSLKTPSACSYSTINTDARGYFNSNKDPVFGLIDAMSRSTDATTAGYQVLGRIGLARDSALVKVDSIQRASKLVNDVLGCMTVNGYVAGTDFSQAFNSTGLFAVRQGSGKTAVVSRGRDGTTPPAPLFGAEPSGLQWHNSAPFILFWGYTLTSLDTDEGSGGQAFELQELPALTFPNVYTTATPPVLKAGAIKAGVCTMTAGARILHQHGVDALLPDAGTPNFCDNLPAPTTNVGFRGAIQRVGSWFTPKPLYAYFRVGGGSALVSDLSPFGPVTFTAVITFTQPPVDTRVKAANQFPKTVTVSVATSKGTKYVGPVTLQVVGNNGSFNITGNTATTNSSGVAEFPLLHIDKAGGYDLSAVTDIGTSAPVTFKIQGL
jgi:hypothetical protein